MTCLARQPVWMQDRTQVFGQFEDWVDNFVSGDRWTPRTADMTDAATQALVLASTGPGGILSLTNDATDEDEVYFALSKQVFKIAADKPCYFETRLQFSEAATDKANVIAGWCSGAAAADMMIDAGGGPIASATQALIYKIEGTTVWRVRSQIGAAVGRTDTVTRHTAGGSAYQILGVEILPVSSTVAEVVYTLDGEIMEDSERRKIKHQLVYTNAVGMGPMFGIKNGSGSAEVLLNDYVGYFQKR